MCRSRPPGDDDWTPEDLARALQEDEDRAAEYEDALKAFLEEFRPLELMHEFGDPNWYEQEPSATERVRGADR